MSHYHITYKEGLLTIGFGDPAQNDQLVKDASQRLDEILSKNELAGGALLKINGPASLPVAFVIAHKVAHLFGAVAVYDPKMEKYILSITHSPDFKLGDLLD